MQLPAPARAVRSATIDAVAAARARDGEAFRGATARLAAAEPEHVRLVLGAVVRQLLEELHPDGLAGDDLVELVKGCARATIPWFPELDVEGLFVVLTGALGVFEPDEQPRRWTPAEVATHAPLFLTELLAHPTPHRSLEQHLDEAFRDRARAELSELP